MIRLCILLFDPEKGRTITKGAQKNILLIVITVTASIVVVTSLTITGVLLLVGIGVAPFGTSWHSSSSYKIFIYKGIITNLLAGLCGTVISLYVNLPIAATVALCCTTAGVITLIFKKRKN
jgi:ABC-type Mn2+/Zn2+ transport system permease subunit